MGSGDKLRLLYAGRLLEWKGVDLAIHAVKALRDRGVAVKLTIAGAGPAQAGLKRLATELKAEPLLRWILWVPHNQLRELYDDHDILVFPSLRDSGGMVVLEALAHGLPVVCTDRGGPASIVNDRCGRVVPTENRTRTQVVDALTDTLHELSLDRILLKRLSRGARARAWEFDFGKVVAKIHPTTPQSLAGSRV
jgi:glycosyltransferase involved in cell wall biosynthesis